MIMAAAMLTSNRRRTLRRERVYRNCSRSLDNAGEIVLKNYRFLWEEILSISGLLRPSLEKATRRSQAVPIELLQGPFKMTKMSLAVFSSCQRDARYFSQLLFKFSYPLCGLRIILVDLFLLIDNCPGSG